jgi:apolipoprotein N-acyltransferase
VVLPALAAGVGLALSLPPWGLWVVALPAAGLLWWRLGDLRLRARLLAGWMAGLGLFVPGLWWALSFNVYGGIVLMAVEALALALACAASPPGRGRAPALAGAMVLAEALRSDWPFGGLPLGGIALGQVGGPLSGSDRLGGPLLVVGLVWLGGAGLGVVWVAVGQRHRHGPEGAGAPHGHRFAGAPMGRTLAAGVASIAAVGAVAAWGAVAPDGGRGVATLRVAAVQGGGVRGLRKAQVNPASVLAAQRHATGEIPAVDGGRPPALVVWPEDVVSLDVPIGGTQTEKALARLAVRLHATLCVGVTETVSATSFRNEIVAFGPRGRIVARFEKVHRVPFGEYVPDRAFFAHLANLSAVPLDAIPGHGDGVLHTPAGPIGTMISYEVFFAARGRIATRAGAEVLIVPTNTSSYSTSQVPTQEVAASRLQAVAEGRDLVQAAPTGFSAIVDNRGRVLARTALGSRQVLVGDVRLRTGDTIYERFGDLPVLVAAAVLVVGGWWAGLAERRRRRPHPRRGR